MKRVWKSLLFAMILTLLFGLTAQAAVKKITIKKPTAKSTTTVTLNAENPQRVFTLKWTSQGTTVSINKIKVKSSNSKVVSVKSIDAKKKQATLVAKKPGKATITVYGPKGRIKDTLKITVKQQVTEIDPKYQYVYVETGKKQTLKYTVLPKTASSKTLTFKTNKKSIATVSSKGVVTGKKAGTAVITAKAKDGSGTSVKFYITVGKKNKKVTKVNASLSKSKIYPGQTSQIKVSVTPTKAVNKKVRYKSMKTSVATVSSKGVVKAVKPGTAKIKVTANDGSRKYKTVTVTVKQPVTGIELNTKNVVLNTVSGMDLPTSVSFTAKALPEKASDKTLKYTSSNEKVAVYKDGKIVAVGKGTCAITVTAADGQGAKSVCNVTVNDLHAVTGITLNTSNVVLNTTEGMDSPTSVSFTASVSPSNATDKTLKYTSSNEKVAVYKDGKIVAVGKGTCTITVNAADGKGAKAVCNVTVKDVQKKVLSVDTSKFGQEYKVNASVKWDNPSTAKSAFNNLACLAALSSTNGKLSYKVAYNGMTYEVVMHENGMSILDPANKDRMDDFLNGRLMNGTVKRNISADRFTQLLDKVESMLKKATTASKFGTATVKTSAATFKAADVQLNYNKLTFKLDGCNVIATLDNGQVTVISEASLDKAAAAVTAIFGEMLTIR